MEATIMQTLDGFYQAFEDRNVEAALAFFADDAVWTIAPGAFKGRQELRRALEWDARITPTIQSRLSGIGLVVRGKVAVREVVYTATFEGISYDYPCVTVFEFGGDGLIRAMRSYYDKLAIEHQIADRYPGVKGWVFEKMVGFLVAQGNRGIDPRRTS
jgi:ketosteroid isomerase-like protein